MAAENVKRKRAIAKKIAEEKRAADKLAAEKMVAEKAILLYPRASLVVNNSFLTALGRPNRETVSTSRESQANLPTGTRVYKRATVQYCAPERRGKL